MTLSKEEVSLPEATAAVFHKAFCSLGSDSKSRLARQILYDYFPTQDNYFRARDLLIRELRSKGRPLAEIAKRLKLHVASVSRIARYRQAGVREGFLRRKRVRRF